MTYHLAWAEEFDGSAGSLPDPKKWALTDDVNYENGTLNAYKPSHGVLDGASHCVLTATKDPYLGRAYTSAKLETSKGPQQLLYAHGPGAFEFRCKTTVGAGLWPSGWLLGASWNWNPPPGVNWPKCGEIDIMEWYTQAPNSSRQSVIPNNGNWFSDVKTLPSGMLSDWHVHRFELDPLTVTIPQMRWFIDGVLTQTATPAQVPAWAGTYDQPFSWVFQLEVGGNGGTPDSTTTWLAQLVLDYVRVYDLVTGTSPTPTNPRVTAAQKLKAVVGLTDAEVGVVVNP